MPLLIALVLVGHAVMHVGAVSCGLLFVSTPPSIVTSTGIAFDAIKGTAVILTSVVVAGYLLAALAGLGVVIPRSWWRPTVLIASAASAIMLVGLFSPAAIFGLALDAAFASAAVRGWSPASARGGERPAHAAAR